MTPQQKAQAEIPRTRESRWRAFSHAAALYISVALGSMIGGMLRAIASPVIQLITGSAFPWDTLFVNVTGSLAIGFYATLTGPEGRLFMSSYTRQFVMSGICGGYTTFSVFSVETLRFVQAGELAVAGGNIGLSIGSWLAAVWLGHMLAAGLNRMEGS